MAVSSVNVCGQCRYYVASSKTSKTIRDSTGVPKYQVVENPGYCSKTGQTVRAKDAACFTGRMSAEGRVNEW